MEFGQLFIPVCPEVGTIIYQKVESKAQLQRQGYKYITLRALRVLRGEYFFTTFKIMLGSNKLLGGNS